MNRWVSEHLCWPLTEQLMRRDTMRRLGQLRQSQHWPADALRKLQGQKLRKLLRLSATHCPFYEKRFRRAGLDPHDPHLRLSDLARLPTLCRDEIREHLEQMTWHACPRGGAQPYNTGGSSGEPLKFYIDRFRQAADWAGRWRAREWWGVRPGDREILLWGAPVELGVQDRARQWRDALLNQHMLSAFNMSSATMAGYVERIRGYRPACMYGYASSLALLSRHAIERLSLPPGGLGSDRLRAVFVTGEVLLPADREVIAAAFGAPVVIEYGSRDAGFLALGCPAGRLHVAQENVIIELLDPRGRPVKRGEVGEVVITHLEALAMPIIRYRIGDLARAPEDSSSSTNVTGIDRRGRCECGLALDAIAEVRGRVTDQIVRRDGDHLRRMHALTLIYVLRDADGIRQFRITQRSLDRVDVDVVCDGRFTPAVEDHVRHGLGQRMGSDVDISIHRRTRIPPAPSGKHACVVSHVD